MTLERLAFDPDPQQRPPPRVSRFLEVAEGRIQAYLEANAVPMLGFVPSDYPRVYTALAHFRHLYGAAERFCEWGSGFGVVVGLAVELGFEACGIEIQSRFVEESIDLLAESHLEASLLEGSFIPEEFSLSEKYGGEELVTDLSGAGANDEVDVTIDDFDIIFAFPWPGEEEMYFDLFDGHGAANAFLLTYHGEEGFILNRKV